MHASFFPFFILINFQRHMHSICVWNMIQQSKPLQTRYDTTYIYDKYYIRAHVYVFLFRVKKRVFELSWVWPWRWPRGGTPYMVSIGPVFHYTIKTCLKRVGYCGYEWVGKKCVSLQRTWVSKRTVCLIGHSLIIFIYDIKDTELSHSLYKNVKLHRLQTNFSRRC